jgi:hypothetical protein
MRIIKSKIITTENRNMIIIVNAGSFILFVLLSHGTNGRLSFLLGKCLGPVVLKLETVTLVVKEEVFRKFRVEEKAGVEIFF